MNEPAQAPARSLMPPMPASQTPPNRLRVAVVQLAFHPALLIDRRSPREDPLFNPGSPDSLSPERGELPLPLKEKLDALRRRIRATYDAQLLGRIKAVLERCSAWRARVVVFPEYSVPWELLPAIAAAAASDMVVVAGTHMVEQAARRSGLYETLGAPSKPAVGQSVCPVLLGGRLLALAPKIHASGVERSSMRPGEAWTPIEMPEVLGGSMGALAALDFLSRESDRYQALIAEGLSRCRLLAVPSLTPHATAPELAGNAWREAHRYGRPVLFSDGAEAGGTSIYAGDAGDAGYAAPDALRRFPDRAGYLEPDDEGVIVADINLESNESPASLPGQARGAVAPFAAASLVYRVHPVGEEYARWLEETEALLASDDDDALEAAVIRIDEARDLLLNAGALSGGEARGRRLRRLLAELDKVTRVEEIRQFTREIVLAKELLPLADLRAAMAGAAADVMFGWLAGREARTAGIVEVEERLRARVDEHRSAGTWTNDGLSAFSAVAQAVRGAPEVRAAEVDPEAKARVVSPAALAPAALGKRKQEGVVLLFRERPAELRALERDAQNQDDVPALPIREIEETEPLYWLAVAEDEGALAGGGESVCAAGVWPALAPEAGTVLVLTKRGEVWEVWTPRARRWPDETWRLVKSALRECGLGEVSNVEIDPAGEPFHARVMALLRRFEPARAAVSAYREKQLKQMNGQLIELEARVNGGAPAPIFEALDRWLASDEQAALVLGEAALGKSMALAEWTMRRWNRGILPLPVFVPLSRIQNSKDAEALLLESAGLENRPANRAALRLLFRGPHPALIPIFDGFDEIARPFTSGDVAHTFFSLLRIAQGGDKMVISSRPIQLKSEASARSLIADAVAHVFGGSAGLYRIEVEPLTDRQIEDVIRRAMPAERDARKVLERLRQIYDVDLTRRPFFLGMMLATSLDPATGRRISPAALFEAFFARWLEQTRSQNPDCFTDAQKEELAESLADELWRSGRAACTWQEIRGSIRARLAQHLPEQMPSRAAFTEILAGGLFVLDGEDGYRFAHTSFLAYFLARSLVAILPRRTFQALRTAPFTREIAPFLGGILARGGEPREAPAVHALQSFLVDGRKPYTTRFPSVQQETSESTAAAAANALRLLLGLKRWAGDGEAWIPEGADLRRVDLACEDLSDASLVLADLERANLTGADLERADLTGAYLEDASLMRARLHRTGLARARARRADFTQADAAGAILDNADFTDAVLRQSLWFRCSWKGAALEGADLTAAAMPGSEPRALARELVRVTPPLAYATVAGAPTGRITAAAWSRDTRCLALADDDNTISVCDYPSRMPLARIDAGSGALSLSWSPDGRRIAAGSSDGSINVFEAVTGAPLIGLKTPPGPIKAVAFSPNGERLAALGEMDASLRLFDGDDFREVLRLECGRGTFQLAWSPDGNQIATLGPGDLVRLWDARSGSSQVAQKAVYGPLAALAWSPDGNVLAVVGSRRIHLLDGKTGVERTFLRATHGLPFAIAWSADSTRLASASAFGSLSLWDCESRAEHRRWTDEGFAGVLVALHWGPSDDLVTRVSSEGEILQTNVSSPDKTIQLVPNNAAERSGQRAIARSPGGYCALPGGALSEYVLALRRPEPGNRTELYLPLGALGEIVHRPEIVAAALEGDTSGDDLNAELSRLGLDNGAAWDGRSKRGAQGPPAAGSLSAPEERALNTNESAVNPFESAPVQPNPFRPGSALAPSPNLPGRASPVSELLALIESRSPAILIGPRRSGKTSLLHHLAARLAQARAPQRVRQVTLEAKRIHTDDDLARVLDPSLHADPSPAETLRRRFEEQPETVLLLDEVANLGAADASVFAWLRALGQEGTSVVFAGSPWDWVRTALHAASAPGSSFGNDVTPVVLGPIPERDAVRFLTDTAPPDVPMKDEMTAQWIVDQCGPWPFYLQVMGYAVVQEVRAGRRKCLVERGALIDLYDQRLLLERDAAFFRARWNELPERARQILRHLRDAPGGELPAFGELSPEDRRILRDTGLCNFGKWLQDKPFYDWIRRSGGDIEDEKKS